MIKIKNKGSFKNFEEYCDKSLKFKRLVRHSEEFAIDCIEKLKANTPIDSGITADSWRYNIIKTKNSLTIQIDNTNIQNGMNIALLLEYGHGTINGGWVEGKNYIEPVIAETYQNIIKSICKEMNRL